MLNDLTPERLALLAALWGGGCAVIGALATWLTGRGTDWYIRISDWRLKKRERQSKIDIERYKASSTARDQILEDKNLAAGYRALILGYDDRVVALETSDRSKADRIAQLENALGSCLSANEKSSNELREVKDRCAKLEEINEKYRSKLLRNGFRPDDASPIYLDEHGKKPDKPFQS